MAGMPAAEVSVSADLVRALISDQHPQYAQLPVVLSGEGWDNFTFRLGKTLAVRLPRRKASVDLLLNEQRWLPALAPRLPMPVTSPVATGAPGRGFPWPWSVVPWIEGAPADIDLPDARQGERLAAFLGALHEPAPEEAPGNPVRGIRLAAREERVSAVIQRLKDTSDIVTPGVERAWAEALKADPFIDRVWLHGDLHARNVLSHQGRLTGVIDWGDMCGGDAATDLLSVWSLLDDRLARAAAIRDYSPSASLLARAMGWAVLFGVTLYDQLRHDDPRHAAGAVACLQRIAEDV
jgi:aminoglycoside phosphotransferase (APT) family kinase protein